MANTQWRNVSKSPAALLLGGNQYKAKPGSTMNIPSKFDAAIAARGLLGACLVHASDPPDTPELAPAESVKVDEPDAKRKSKN